MSRMNKQEPTTKYTTNLFDYKKGWKVKSLEIGNHHVDVSHKPSTKDVVIMIIDRLPRSKVEEFLINSNPNFFVHTTKRLESYSYDRKTGFFYRGCNNMEKIQFLNKLFSYIRIPLRIKFLHDEGNINMFCKNC